MAKRKLTPEILELIELCAADVYELDEIREEVDIAKPLMEDTQVLEAIERGRVKWLIEIVATNGDIDSFLFYSDKTLDEAGEMMEIHAKAIELRKSELETEKQKVEQKNIHTTEMLLSAASIGGYNIYCQLGEDGENIHANTLRDGIASAVKKLKEGDTSLLLEVLVSNTIQLHKFNGHIAQNLMGEIGKQLSGFEKLSSMQLKVMQETRKSILAINEITNPRRTTFIKEANQHNHLHQNSEKKDENDNELQKQLKRPDETTDAVLFETKDTVNEKK